MTIVTSLKELFAIPGWGQTNYCGDYFTIKYCFKASAETEQRVAILKRRYPHLYAYKAKTGNILFGGRFHKNEGFLQDRERVFNGDGALQPA